MKAEFAKVIRISSENTICPVLRFTGIQIERDRNARTIRIHQERYIEQMSEQLNPSGEANRPTVDGYSTLSRGLARALLARHAVAASKR